MRHPFNHQAPSTPVKNRAARSVNVRGIGRSLSRGMAVLFVAASVSACSHPVPAVTGSDVLLCMGDSALTVDDVVRRIPVGISPSDSVALFHSITDNWVAGMVLADMAASKLPEIEDIERKVEAYRNRLIVAEYMKRMRDSRQFKVSPDSVRSFYDSHRAEMIAETPLVKGIYLKIPTSSIGIDDVRESVFSATEAGIDRLEKNWIGEAIQYDYFIDEWVDWSLIADQIPYRFYDPDAFLASTRNFETSADGQTYLLHVSDYLPAGSELPFEFASKRISAILEQAKIADYEQALVRSLIKKAINENRLQAVGYDPLTHRKTAPDRNKENKNLKDEK